jgi:hypothetical protein
MLAAHFPGTYGEKLEHQHNGIIAVMRVGRDGKMRPNLSVSPRDDSQSGDIVESAERGVAELTQVRVGMVVREPSKSSAELEAFAATISSRPIEIEFVEADGTEESMRVDDPGPSVPAAEEGD